MTRIQVAVGIAFNQRGDVLVGQRTVKDRYFGKWEFPGGKLEAEEDPITALAREFAEEVGIQVQATEPLMVLQHDYPDRQVILHVFLITGFSGRVRAMEGQALKWVAVNQLRELDFLAGNLSMIEVLEARFS